MGGPQAHRVPLRRALAAVTAAALLAGCSGSGGDDGAEPAAAPPATEVTATRDPLPVPAGYAGYRSEVYADPAHWVCRPDTDDVCDRDNDATVVAADGTLTPEPFRPAPDPAIDCFYVYPTISRDPSGNSDLTASPTEEGAAARAQVARLGAHCRVFAPTYRQITLTALTAGLRGESLAGIDPGRAIGDVVDAWKHYLANDNGGRGVVLVGHSQGAGLITQLIAREIDPNEDVRAFLVSAFIAGSGVAVPPGADVGGDFANTPLCRRPDQVGCVVTWSSFRSTSPPPATSRFGKVRATGQPAACVSPAALGGGKAVSKPYFGPSPQASIVAVGADASGAGSTWVDPAKGTVPTLWVTTPGLVEVECVERDGFGYLEVTVHGDPADPRADDIGGDLTPDWGLHLLDEAVVMGDMVDLVGRQAEAFGKASASN